VSSSPAEGDDTVRLNEMVCFNLHAASRAMTAVYRPLLEPLGLTYPQYLVMTTLWEHGDLSVRDLVARLQLDYGTMTPLLKRLEKRDLLRRTRNPDDERTVLVSLTDEGDAMRTHAPGIYRAICETFDFTPTRAREALALLQSIADRAT
jgi:DNA-binding MarR family transcriptional regulator